MRAVRILLAAAIAGFVLHAAPPAFAASDGEAKAMLDKAVAAEAEAGALRNQWTATEGELKAARLALAAKDFDKALAAATRAEAMARRSAEQAREQDKAWHDAVIQ